MPGAKDNNSYRADYMTSFAEYRVGITADDTGPDDVAIPQIVTRKSISAVDHNKIFFVLESTNMALEVTCKLYVKVADGPLNDTWLLVDILQNCGMRQFIRFNELYAGNYKLVVAGKVGVDPLDVFESHTNLNWDTALQLA